MAATQYVEIDSDSLVSGLIDSDHITIEGADVLVGRRDEKATRVEDYLGIGNPLIYR
jgi:hypothetical protein